MTSLDWINIKDYPTVQAAVDAAAAAARPNGGTVYVPAGIYDPNTTPTKFVPPLDFPTDKPIRLVGDGPRVSVLSQRIFSEPDVDLVHVRGDLQCIEGLTLRGSQSASGTGVGVRIWRSADPPSGASNIVYRPSLLNCEIYNVPGWGILVDDAVRNGQKQICVGASYDGVEIHDVQIPVPVPPCVRGCAYLGSGGTTDQHFRNCNFKNFHGVGVRAKFVNGIAFDNCIIEKNGYDSTCSYIDLEGCNHTSIRHCWLEGINKMGAPYIRLYYGEYLSVVVDATTVRQKGYAPDPNDITAVAVEGMSRGIYIGSLDMRLPGTAASGQGEHLYVAGPISGREPEVMAGCCGVTDGTGGIPLVRIRAGSLLASLLTVSHRDRIVQVSEQERNTLQDLKAGDLIFNTDARVGQVYDGSAWQNLW